MTSLRYEPGPPATVDLGDNTNLWGTPPAAQAALLAAAARGVSRYPSAYGDRLKEAAARHVGVTAAQVITGCGSDDVLDVAIRTAAAPGERLAFSAPTFTMIPIFGEINRLANVAVPFQPDWDVDVDRLLAARAEVTFLCAPNNPTGTGISRAAIEAIVRNAAGLVIIDEAYAEYAGTTAVDLVEHSDRLFVTRTLSKAFGLAGQRVGYGIGAPALIRRLEAARGPYKVTTISEAAAVAALEDDREWVAARVAETLAIRARFESAVAAETTWQLLPSQANFVLAVPAPGSPDSVDALIRRLRARDISGRRIDDFPGEGGAMRLTIGPWEMLAPVVEAMAEGGAR